MLAHESQCGGRAMEGPEPLLSTYHLARHDVPLDLQYMCSLHDFFHRYPGTHVLAPV